MVALQTHMDSEDGQGNPSVSSLMHGEVTSPAPVYPPPPLQKTVSNYSLIPSQDIIGNLYSAPTSENRSFLAFYTLLL